MRTWTKYIHDDIEHEKKLDGFLATPDLPKYVSTREDLKLHLFREHPASEFYMLVDDETGNMVGCCGFYVLEDENGITYCKSPYRLYILPEGNGGYAVNRNSWENVTKSWLEKWHDIPFLATINEGNEKILFWENISMKRYCDRLPPDDPFIINQKSFYLHPKLVYEMYTWQYAYYTPNYVGFKRQEKEMDPAVKEQIEKDWAKGYWLGQGGRNKLE